MTEGSNSEGAALLAKEGSVMQGSQGFHSIESVLPVFPGVDVVSANTRWYFQAQSTKEPSGPWSVAHLRSRWQQHHIDGLTPVWESGMEAWKPLSEVPELKASLQQCHSHDSGEGDAGVNSSNSNRRRPALDDLPMTHFFTSDASVLYVFDAVDNEWKVADMYELLVSEQAREEGGGAKEAEEAKKAEAEVVAEALLPPEAEDALAELLADVRPDGAAAGVVDKGPEEPLPPEKEAKRQKRREYRERKKLKVQAGVFVRAKTNPNVYVSGLPPDVSGEELEKAFKRAGVLKVDLETGEAKMRIYTDDQGSCKGDALITFANHASVDLAVQFLHEFELRPQCRICVQQADFEEQDRGAALSKEELKKLAVARDSKEGRAKLRAAKQLQKHAVSWDGEMDDGSGQRIVVLKHMFSTEEAATEGPEFYKELVDEIKEDCAKIGQVLKVTPFERHRHGIVCVKFKTSAEAEECIRVMDGRFFAGRTVEAFLYDGKTDFRVLGIVPREVASAGEAPAAATSSPLPVEAAEEEAPPSLDKPQDIPQADKTWDEFMDGQFSDSDDSETRVVCEE